MLIQIEACFEDVNIIKDLLSDLGTVLRLVYRTSKSFFY